MDRAEDQNQIESCIREASAAYARERFDVAQGLLLRAVLAIAEQPAGARARALRVTIFTCLGHTHLRQSSYQDAILAYGVATAAAKGAGDLASALRVDVWIGETHRRAGRDLDAEIRWREVIRDAHKTGPRAEAIRVDAMKRLAHHLESRGRSFEAARIQKLVGRGPGEAEPSFGGIDDLQ